MGKVRRISNVTKTLKERDSDTTRESYENNVFTPFFRRAYVQNLTH